MWGARTTGVDTIATVLLADKPRDLFGDADEDAARPIYRRLERQVHPDLSDDPRAADAFHHLNKLWSQLTGKTPAAASGPVTIETKQHLYTVGDKFAQGDVANLYHVTYDTDQRAVLKMARSPRDSDLISAEASALKTLHEKVDERYRFFHPQMTDSFRHRDAATKVDRGAIVLDWLDGFYSLRQVRDAYPSGIDARDMAWMLRRLLIALDTAHAAGLVHAAVTPDHVMIHPDLHGVVLIDWTCSVESGGSLRAIAPAYRSWYTDEALDKKPVNHSLDVSMAASSMSHLLGADAPRQILAFLRGCKVSSPPTAGELLEEFDELLQRLYGARRFRPFSMSTTGRTS